VEEKIGKEIIKMEELKLKQIRFDGIPILVEFVPIISIKIFGMFFKFKCLANNT
jgi:hypothetical protein